MNLEIDLGLDSLARAEVFAALEQAFETEFTADQAANALTVANVVELVGSTPKGAEMAGSASSDDTAISGEAANAAMPISMWGRTPVGRFIESNPLLPVKLLATDQAVVKMGVRVRTRL